MTRGMLNVRVIVTLLVLVPFQAVVLWALFKGILDVKSYLVGASPMAGMALKYWLDAASSKEPTP